MKKKITAIILLLVLTVMTVSASSGIFELTQVYYPIYSNGRLVPEDGLPVLSYNDRTYVPLRKLSEASGIDVYFENDTIYLENTTKLAAKVLDVYYRAIDIINENDRCIHCLLEARSEGSHMQDYVTMAENYFNCSEEEVKNFKIYAQELASSVADENFKNDIYSKISLTDDLLWNLEQMVNVTAGWAQGKYTKEYMYSQYNAYYNNYVVYETTFYNFDMWDISGARNVVYN